jgi:AcrR family transcriptional regulator
MAQRLSRNDVTMTRPHDEGEHDVSVSSSGGDAPRHTPRRGRPLKTSQDDILKVALRIADTEGLAALTMRRLADEVGLAVMTLYNYVPTKEDLLDRLGEVALGALNIDPDSTADWDEKVFAAMMGVHRALEEHPCGIEVIAAPQPVTGPGVDRLRDRLLAILYAAGFSPQDAVDTITTLFAYVIGVADVETGRARRATDMQQYIESLNPGEYPTLTANPAAWVRALPTDTIELTLRVIIDTMAKRALH